MLFLFNDDETDLIYYRRNWAQGVLVRVSFPEKEKDLWVANHGLFRLADLDTIKDQNRYYIPHPSLKSSLL